MNNTPSSPISNIRPMAMYLILGIGFIALWVWGMNKLVPEPPKVIKPYQETAALMFGGVAAGIEPVNQWRRVGVIETEEQIAAKKALELEREAGAKKEAEDQEKEAPTTPFELISMGHGDNPYYLQVLLNTLGGSVQRVILTEFPEADREGLMVKKPDGTPQAEPLIPGSLQERTPTLRGQRDHPYPNLEPGIVKDSTILGWISKHQPSYQMFHYEKPNDERPEYNLGEAIWNVVERQTDGTEDNQKVVFETKLDTPNHKLRIRKTYTLNRHSYHLGLRIEIFPFEAGKTRSEPLRYQLTGANGLPIEGEWYTSTYRQAMIGLVDKKGNASRVVTDGREVRNSEGSDRIRRDDNHMIRFASVNVQYFASVIAVDNEQVEGQKQDFIEFVRATPMGKTHKEKTFLDDLTVRVITEPLDADKNITHQYVLYQGPLKVRLLSELPGNKEVAEALVDRYTNSLHLRLLTDAPMDYALGRFTSSIYWTDLVIAFTNTIHSLLWVLNQFIPSRGLCIIFITLMVRGLLFPLSRRQAYNTAVMQAKMAKIAPDLKKIQDQYGNDFQRYNQEKMKLMREKGVNPFAMMGGCVLLFLQMPVFMGLYYALQESIFFRLDPFLWMPSLAAPDMLVRWGESIPYISTPNDLGDMTYLGPYLNILPIIAVLLMMIQQSRMLPVTEDPQMLAQQRMMKFMMIFMGVFFFKMAAGMCLYFIATTVWGLLERSLVPKVDLDKLALAKRKSEEYYADPSKPLGWWGRKKQGWREKWEQILEDAKKQNEFKREPRPPQNPEQGGDDKRGKKKKKKK